MNVSSTNKQRKYLIAIGSPSCKEMDLSDLARVKNDIQKVEKLLTKEEQSYERVLKDSIYTGATSSKIKTALTTWFTSEERRNSDCVIIYYAGHAGEEREQNSHYLYTIESNPSDLFNTTIKTDHLADILFPENKKRNSPQNILLILDVCYAGQGAANVLVSSLTQKRNATENISFCIIASADSKTEAGDGDFVDAFEKVMTDSDWMKSRGEFLPICDLVSHINKFLGEKCKADNKGIQEASWSILPNSREITFFCNPRFLKKNRTKTKCDKQEIADLLWLLDYSAQEQVFKEVTQNCKERAFLVQTDEEKIQRWLVRRLARCVSDFDRAKKYHIRIRSHPMRSDFDAFWHTKQHLQDQKNETGEQLKLWDYYIWNIKSTTRARDGLYTYDAVARLRDAQLMGTDPQRLREFLGIIATGQLKKRLEDKKNYRTFGPLGQALQKHSRRPILLIDEIDKADSDFANDLLLELEELRFEIPETGESFPPPEHKPIIFITSNHEKPLPEPFLRRCLYFFVKFPNQQQLKEIIDKRFGESEKNKEELVNQAMTRFYEIRELLEDKPGSRPPGTSEFIEFLTALLDRKDVDKALKDLNDLSDKLPLLGTLLKTKQDQELYHKKPR